MCKIILSIALVCIIQHVSSYALGDPLVSSIQNARLALNAAQQEIGIKIQALGTEIGNVKASNSIVLNNIQNEARESSTACAIETIQAVDLVFREYDVLEQCRNGNEFGLIRNSLSTNINYQINLANQKKRICSSAIDYNECASAAADEINAEVEAIVAKVQADSSALSDAGSECIASSSTAIQADVQAVSEQWANCKA